MQQDKITDLPELATAAADDVLEITDVSTSSSNKIQAQNLAAAVVTGMADGSIATAKLADRAVTSEKLTPTIGFYATTTQSMPQAVETVVTSFTTVADYGGDFSAGIFTAPVGGFYHFDCLMSFENPSSTTDGRILLFFMVNGVTVAQGHDRATLTTTDPVAQVSIDYPLESGDTVSVKVNQLSGVAENMYMSYFSGHLIGVTG